MKNGKSNRSYKNILIGPKFQLKYVLSMFSMGAALVLAYGGGVYAYLSASYALLSGLETKSSSLQQLVHSELDALRVYIIVWSCLFLVVSLIAALRTSHQAAGPIYHVQRVIRDIRNGNTSERVRLRPNDDFQDLAKELNELLDQLLPGQQTTGPVRETNKIAK